MKRLLQWTFNSMAAVSALLFVATCVLWVRSYFAAQRIALSRFDDEKNRTYWTWDEIQIGWGGIGFNRVVQSGDRATYRQFIRSMLAKTSAQIPLFHRAGPAEYPNFHVGVGDSPRFGFKWGGFSHGRSGVRPQSSGFQFVAPFWCLFLASLFLPAAWAWRRRSGCGVGLCPACGYDLRARPDRCPECGTVPTAKATT